MTQGDLALEELWLILIA